MFFLRDDGARAAPSWRLVLKTCINISFLFSLFVLLSWTNFWLIMDRILIYHGPNSAPSLILTYHGPNSDLSWAALISFHVAFLEIQLLMSYCCIRFVVVCSLGVCLLVLLVSDGCVTARDARSQLTIHPSYCACVCCCDFCLALIFLLPANHALGAALSMMGCNHHGLRAPMSHDGRPLYQRGRPMMVRVPSWVPRASGP